MSDLDHVLILAGGLSAEREVSLRSGARLRDALREAGVEADIADEDAALIAAITSDPPSAVFPAIHGAYGEDGSIQEVLALLGVPFVGATADACRFAVASPYTPPTATHLAGLTLTRPQRRFRVIHPSGLPLACGTRIGRALSGFPPSFEPRRPRAGDARRGGARP